MRDNISIFVGLSQECTVGGIGVTDFRGNIVGILDIRVGCQSLDFGLEEVEVVIGELRLATIIVGKRTRERVGIPVQRRSDYTIASTLCQIGLGSFRFDSEEISTNVSPIAASVSSRRVPDNA